MEADDPLEISEEVAIDESVRVPTEIEERLLDEPGGDEPLVEEEE